MIVSASGGNAAKVFVVVFLGTVMYVLCMYIYGSVASI